MTMPSSTTAGKKLRGILLDLEPVYRVVGPDLGLEEATLRRWAIANLPPAAVQDILGLDIHRIQAFAELFTTQRMNPPALHHLLGNYYLPRWAEIGPLLGPMKEDPVFSAASRLVEGGFGAPLASCQGALVQGFYQTATSSTGHPSLVFEPVLIPMTRLQGVLLASAEEAAPEVPGLRMGNAFGFTETVVAREARVIETGRQTVSPFVLRALRQLIHGVEVLRLGIGNGLNWCWDFPVDVKAVCQRMRHLTLPDNLAPLAFGMMLLILPLVASDQS